MAGLTVRAVQSRCFQDGRNAAAGPCRRAVLCRSKPSSCSLHPVVAGLLISTFVGVAFLQGKNMNGVVSRRVCACGRITCACGGTTPSTRGSAIRPWVIDERNTSMADLQSTLNQWRKMSLCSPHLSTVQRAFAASGILASLERAGTARSITKRHSREG